MIKRSGSGNRFGSTNSICRFHKLDPAYLRTAGSLTCSISRNITVA